MRFFLTLFVFVLTLSISGISSAMVANTGDDCCADGAGESSEGDRDLGGDACPPFCHACACSPSFAVPAMVVPLILRPVDREPMVLFASQLPPSPPVPGVFHPPRRCA